MIRVGATDGPKFSIWLGDDWPGPYIVTHHFKKKVNPHITVVNGVRNVAEALCVAMEEYAMDENDIESVGITVGHVAEASHHLQALKTFREESEVRAEAIKKKRGDDEDLGGE